MSFIVLAQRRQQPADHSGSDRIMQNAISQNAIIAKRNEQPVETEFNLLIYIDFFGGKAWHAGCITATD